MKRIRDFPKYRKFQEQVGRRTARNRAGRDGHRKRSSIARRRRRIAIEANIQVVFAPENFSFVNNPERMIDFVGDLKTALYVLRKSVLIDLSLVNIVTNDAIILMLSVAHDKHLPKWIQIDVTMPMNEAAAKRLRESGIEEHLGIREIGQPKSGRIRVRSSYDADSEMANELIQHATRTLFGKRMPLKKVQRILGECITNTEEHAGGNEKRPKEKMWWGTVFCEPNVACFSLLDNGVGIIESLKAEWFTRLPMLARYSDNIKLMRAVFDGKILSSTNLSNRGNGLPAIYKARNKKEFTRLILITNNVFIDFDNDMYRLLPKSFSGTFFYWEVEKNDK